MRVWVIQTGEPVQTDNGELRAMRGINLTDALVAKGHEVTFWTSDFFHQKKIHRFGGYKEQKVKKGLTLRFISSPGYKSNIGFGRLMDHFFLAFNLWTALRLRPQEAPDVVFIGYPPIEIAFVAARWLGSRSIPFAVDVKDLWPSTFVDALPAPLRRLGKYIFAPYYILAKSVFSNASGLCASSGLFLAWVEREFGVQLKNKKSLVSPLSSPISSTRNLRNREERERWKEKGIDFTRHKVLVFAGSLTRSFDFLPLKKFADHAQELDPSLRLVICGGGEKEAPIAALFASSFNVVLPGWISPTSLSYLYSNSMGCVAPYMDTENFSYNFPNKIIESFGFGLPVFTSLKGQIKEFLVTNDCGFSYSNGLELYELVEKNLSNKARLKQIRGNALKVYEEHFEFSKVYDELAEFLEKL